MKPAPALPYLLSVVILALAYAVAGWLSLNMAIPPGYAVPVFPAAGIAMAALHIYGRRLWPGVLLGSLAVQALAGAAVGATSPLVSVLALAPVAAALQAVLGACLIDRFIGRKSAFDDTASILRLLALIAPASCLVSATVSTPLLVQEGLIAREDLFFNWWNWWLGDTLGVIIATPLMLVLFGRPAADWRSRRNAVAVPLLVALAMLSIAFKQVISWEENRIHAQFERDAHLLATQVQRRFDAQIDMMLSISGLISNSNHLTREAFEAFVSPWLHRYPGTQNFAWNPLVRNDEREAFEAIMQEDTPGYRILDRDLQGQTFPAAQAARYYPIAFVEPRATNLSVIGMSPYALPAAAVAIETSQRSGRPVASDPFRLVQERDDQRGMVVYLATLAPGWNKAAARTGERRSGIVSAAFRMDDAIASALDPRLAALIELCLIDRSGGAPGTRLSGTPGCEGPGWLDRKVRHAHAFEFGERPLEVLLRATPAYLLSLRSWAALGTVVVALLATALLGAFLLISSGNTRRIAALVERRTQELEATHADLHDKQAALNEAMRIAQMGSWESFDGLRGLRCSHGLHGLLGRQQAELSSIDDIVASFREDDQSALREIIDELTQAAGLRTIDCRTLSEPPRVLHLQIESEWSEHGLGRLRGILQDVTRARESEAHIHYLARFDTLTGLPNRSAWLEHGAVALRSATRHHDRFAVLFLDLDNFKTINDSLGHAMGDRLLETVAHRLSACVRAEDQLARLGGDEFVALLPRIAGPTDAAAVARKMLDILAAAIELDDHELRPSVSIGIALFPEDGDTVEILLKHADTAMYGAKAAGRNNFQFFTADMNVRATERLLLENALRRAIATDQLSLHYQPQIDARSGRTMGCEALVRWNDPAQGPISPARFIPVAEDSGLIIQLGDWVLREACRQQVRWSQAGLGEVCIAVNISALQFRRAEFVDSVIAILQETGASPSAIELEITESALMQPGEQLLERLHQLVGHGLSLALDDFGTGYSSLAYLKRLPIARLKVDQSFVADLPGDPEDAAVVTATLSMARDLGLEVVAEGVETQQQRAFLCERQCTLMQGYLFSRPLAADDFAGWLKAHPPA